jgi:bifunctional non-homologous end joining protein LigD
MSQLEEYKQKRNSKNTREPKSGESHCGKLRFVVYKRAASYLHYDFRRVVKGFRKSWAVPHGPSMNRQEKRLTIPVEDHPSIIICFEDSCYRFLFLHVPLKF